MFNTDEPCMRAFNKPTNIKFSDFVNSLDYNFYNLMNRISENRLEKADYERIKQLPNFDAEIFEEITGIEVR
jgi:hypothetical protein